MQLGGIGRCRYGRVDLFFECLPENVVGDKSPSFTPERADYDRFQETGRRVVEDVIDLDIDKNAAPPGRMRQAILEIDIKGTGV
jgi:hypothetical protein